MAAQRPEEIHRLWAAAYNAGDLELLCALYEAEATLLPAPGKAAATGLGAIRRVLQGFLAQKGDATIEIETQSVLEAGDLALLRSRWRLTGHGRDGQRFESIHRSTELVRCQPNGSWLYVIDNPFGAD